MSDITKRALEASLKKMLLKKPVTKITISDITEDCGVNRATFYYHFKDIYDLIEWSCEEDSRIAANGNTTYDTWEQGYLYIFQAVEENKPFILNVYRHVVGQRIEGDANDKLFFRPLKNRPRSLGANGRLTAIIRHIIGEY